ncbi:MAG: hypothetical protein Q8R79_00600 [Legionellaceae bacterium]|nr:hypothetical protein [Legionellaceae bacterium]
MPLSKQAADTSHEYLRRNPKEWLTERNNSAKSSPAKPYDNEFANQSFLLECIHLLNALPPEVGKDIEFEKETFIFNIFRKYLQKTPAINLYKFLKKSDLINRQTMALAIAAGALKEEKNLDIQQCEPDFLTALKNNSLALRYLSQAFCEAHQEMIFDALQQNPFAAKALPDSFKKNEEFLLRAAALSLPVLQGLERELLILGYTLPAGFADLKKGHMENSNILAEAEPDSPVVLDDVSLYAPSFNFKMPELVSVPVDVFEPGPLSIKSSSAAGSLSTLTEDSPIPVSIGNFEPVVENTGSETDEKSVESLNPLSLVSSLLPVKTNDNKPPSLVPLVAMVFDKNAFTRLENAFIAFQKKIDALPKDKKNEEHEYDVLRNWFKGLDECYQSFKHQKNKDTLNSLISKLEETQKNLEVKVEGSLQDKMNQHRHFGKLNPLFRAFLGFCAMVLGIIPSIIVQVNSSAGYMRTFFGQPDTDTMKQYKKLEVAVNNIKSPG